MLGQYRGPSRPRLVNTCRECKRRKLRCDQTRPSCTRCANTEGVTCVYDADAEEVRDFQFVPVDTPVARRSRASVSARGGSVSTSGPDIVVSTERLRNLEERLESLTGMVQSLQSTNSSERGFVEISQSRADSQTQSQSQSQTQSQSTKRSRQSPFDTAISREGDDGHLDVQAGGKTRYVSRSFWATICQEANEIEFLLRNQARQESLSDLDDQPWRRGSLTGSLLSAPPATPPTIRASLQKQITVDSGELPDRKCCDSLLESYIWNFHPIVPLIHVPSFRKEYERFWELRSRSRGQATTQNTALVFAVLFAGAVACTNASFERYFRLHTRENLTLQLFWMSSKALRLSNFPRVPTVEALSAYMILQGTWMREEEPLTTCSFVGVIVRVAQMLGLNKEPSLFRASVSPVAAEVRRRVWWHVFRIDVIVALASGLPPLIDRGSWDVNKMTELKEEYIGTITGQQYQQSLHEGFRESDDAKNLDSMVSPVGIFICGKIEESIFARELLNKIFGPKLMTVNDLKRTQADLGKLRNEMLSRIARIPMETPNETYENNYDFNIWAKILLSSMGDQHWWFMHSPLLSRAINQAWNELLPQVLDHCRAYLQKFVCLAGCREFQRFQWAWPGNHQPLHAIMILLKEVERNPQDSEAHVSQSAVDQTIALCGPSGGVSGMQDDEITPRPLTEGGQEAWGLIMRLRSRAWIKAGADPDIIPTREQVVRLAQEQLKVILAVNEIGAPLHWPGLQLQAFESPIGNADHGLSTPNLNWRDWDTIFGGVEYE